MEPALVRTLQDHQPHIRKRWETLLRTELVNTPLANPDLLVPLFDSTLDEVFNALRTQPAPARTESISPAAAIRALCACSRNPLLAYFVTGEQALLETLVQLEASGHLKPDSASAELLPTIRLIARREVETFCSLCQHRQTIPGRAQDISSSRNQPRFRQTTPGHEVPAAACAMQL